MGRRTFITLSLVAVAVAPISLLAGFRSATAEEYAARNTRQINAAVSPASIQWVIRPSDIAACESAAPELRTILHDYRDQVRVTAYYVGNDTALVRSFLRSERLGRVDVQLISEREFVRDFARRFTQSVKTPFIVLHTDATSERAFFVDVRAADGRRDVDALSRALATVFRGAPAPASRRPNVSQERRVES